MDVHSTERLARIKAQLEQARRHDRDGRLVRAELLYTKLLPVWTENGWVAFRLAQLALGRNDTARAIRLLESAIKLWPDEPQLGVELAVVHLMISEPALAISVLESTLTGSPSFAAAWLLLGQVHDELGDSANALKAWYQAVTRAQRAGQWRDEGSTPAPLLDSVVRAIESVRLGRRDLFFGAYDDVRQKFGEHELKRVDRAVSGFLRDWDATPADPRQRPRFLFFPDLPSSPYHDPYLQPWAARLKANFPLIRADAIRVVAEDRKLPNFVNLKAGDRLENYVKGTGPQPSWEAFFFYRHGERYDANHARCPNTSNALDAIELCRISEHAPEICFSVLKPGSHILPHYGVTNTRLVMHLPLVVPPDCALNIVDVGEHHWEEGQLVMFDDTFAHEAWNRSDATRIVLLMDCWNPHLTQVEKIAVKRLIETIGGLHLADKPRTKVDPAA